MAILDIEKLDSQDPNDTVGLDAIGGMIDDIYKSNHGFLESLAMVWEENVRFLQGEQHIRFNSITRRYEVIPVTKYNDFIPRPVTNYILPIFQTVTSLLTKNKPDAKVSANSNDPKDRDAAILSDRIVDAKWEEDDETVNHVKAAKILLSCGTVIRKDYWDNTKGPMSPVIQGRVGDTAVDIIDPFRFVPDIESKTWYLEANVQPLFWIRGQYSKTVPNPQDPNGEPIPAPGYTGLANEVREDKDLSPAMTLWQRLKTSAGSGYGGGSSKSENLTGCAVVKECYIKPTQKYPRGRLIVVAGGRVLYFGDSPEYDERYEDSWHPYSFCKWEDIFFRWHGLSLVEHLVPLQKRINAIDSLIILNRMTCASPTVIIPNGCGVPEGYFNGRPGLNVVVNPVGANGVMPQRWDGKDVSQGVWEEREQAVQSMHVIAGDNEVLQGARPEGVNTATGLQMLLEQSYSKFSPFIQQWEKFIERGQTKKLRLVAKHYAEPRPEFIGRLKEMNKDNLDVEVRDFIGSDLRDNISVRIETGSSLPRSKLAEQESYREMGTSGMFGPIDPMSNPVGNEEFLEKFGMKPIATQVNADVKKARYVNTVLTAINRGELGTDAYPMLLPVEQSPETVQIHLKILTDRMKAPEFKDEMQMFQNRFMELQGLMQQFMAQQAAANAQMAAQQGQPSNSQLPQGAGISSPGPTSPSPREAAPIEGSLQ